MNTGWVVNNAVSGQALTSARCPVRLRALGVCYLAQRGPGDGCACAGLQLPVSRTLRRRASVYDNWPGRMHIWVRERNPIRPPHRAGATAAAEATLSLQWQEWRDGSLFVPSQSKCYFYMQQTHLAKLKIGSFLLGKICLTHLHMFFIFWYFIKAMFLDNNIFQYQTQR